MYLHKYNIRNVPFRMSHRFSPEDKPCVCVCVCHCCLTGKEFKINLGEMVNTGKYKSHGNTCDYCVRVSLLSIGDLCQVRVSTSVNKN